jgi:hypothetical protein
VAAVRHPQKQLGLHGLVAVQHQHRVDPPLQHVAGDPVADLVEIGTRVECDLKRQPRSAATRWQPSSVSSVSASMLWLCVGTATRRFNGEGSGRCRRFPAKAPRVKIGFHLPGRGKTKRAANPLRRHWFPAPFVNKEKRARA